MSLWIDTKKLTRNRKFLKEMDNVTPYKSLEKILKEKYEKNNTRWRPQYELKLMLRIHILQNLYTLWDEAMEEAIYDRLSFQEYLRIDLLSNRIPDATTIENFRHFLEENKFQERIFKEIVKILEEKWIILKKWTIVDATLIKASSSTKNKKKKRDEEMSSTRKNNNYHFGWKIHIWTDMESWVVHSVELTKASINDIEKREELLHWEERAIFWDKAYGDKKKKKECREKWIYYWISDKRSKYVELSKNQKKKNKNKSRVRWKVEYIFWVIKCKFWFRKFSYKWIEKNRASVFMKIWLANLYICRKKLLMC